VTETQAAYKEAEKGGSREVPESVRKKDREAVRFISHGKKGSKRLRFLALPM
jgi:hypothetical protein